MYDAIDDVRELGNIVNFNIITSLPQNTLLDLHSIISTRESTSKFLYHSKVVTDVIGSDTDNFPRLISRRTSKTMAANLDRYELIRHSSKRRQSNCVVIDSNDSDYDALTSPLKLAHRNRR